MASLEVLTAKRLSHHPKAHTACARIEELARRLGPEAKLPKVVELCTMLQVSPVTLTKALDELERRSVIYRIQGRGIFVSPRLHRRIQLICDPTFMRGSSHSPFWDLLMAHAQNRAQLENEELSYHFAMPPTWDGAPLHQGLMEQISSGSAEGVLGVGLSTTAAEWIESHGVPFVAMAGPGQHRVTLDREELIRCGVRVLAAQGCRRIGLWSDVGPYRCHSYRYLNAVSDRRLQVLQSTLEEVGLPFEISLVQNNHHVITEEGGLTNWSVQEQGYQTVQRVWGQENNGVTGLLPDGIVITNDLMTHGALAAFNALQVKPGRDIAIASHATKGSAILMGCENDITLIDYDPSEVAREMFDVLQLLMDNQPAPTTVAIMPHLRTPHLT